jgi:DNA polymerase-3 subunit epsilon
MTDLAQEAALELAVERLEASGDYRVLRRLGTRLDLIPPANAKRGILLDCETTGLDPATDEIIELALVPFTYTPEDGRIYEVGPVFTGYRQPSRPIPLAMTAIHGIDDAMVAGKTIDPAEVAAVIADAAPIIAHHAEFDRPFVEKLFPEFATRPWACSMSQIDWKAEGYESAALYSLATACGFFYDRHLAVADCMAAIALLERELPRSGKLAFLQLLERGRQPTWRVVAEGSPFQKKDELKARGYRWNAEKKVWFIDADDPNIEVEFLAKNIYRRLAVDLPVLKITAFDRFSVRAS